MRHRSNKLKSFSFLLASLLFLGSEYALSQKLPESIPFRDGKTWGYSDSLRQIKIQPQFQAAGLFNQGIAVVEMQEGFFLIDKDGNLLTKSGFQKIDILDNQPLAKVNLNGKFGLLDLKGREVMAPILRSVSDFKENLAMANKDGQFGMINPKGSWVIEPKYSWVAGEFSENLMGVRNIDGFRYIDRNGKTAFQAAFDFGFPFSDGYAAVLKNRKIGFIDHTGKEVIPFVYDIPVVRRPVKDAEGHSTGKESMSKDNSKEQFRFLNGIAKIHQEGLFGFIDKSGKTVIKLVYEELSEFNDGLSLAKKEGKWGMIDLSEKIVIPFKYEEIGPLCEGLARAKKEGKWGYINQKGQKIVDFEYDHAWDFKNGKATVGNFDHQGRLFGQIDNEGKLIIPLIYEVIAGGQELVFTDGIAVVRLDDYFGAIDTKGNEVIPFKYRLLDPFFLGLAAEKTQFGIIGFLDRYGNEYWK